MVKILLMQCNQLEYVQWTLMYAYSMFGSIWVSDVNAVEHDKNVNISCKHITNVHRYAIVNI